MHAVFLLCCFLYATVCFIAKLSAATLAALKEFAVDRGLDVDTGSNSSLSIFDKCNQENLFLTFTPYEIQLMSKSTT